MKYSKIEFEAVLGIISIFKGNNITKSNSLKSTRQIKILNYVFKLNMYPSADLRYDLSILLNYSPRTIQIWFQNKRQSLKLRNKNFTKMFYRGKDVNLNNIISLFYA
ncbi:homeobox domain-containing protein [Vairimorpha apis BRL 01]|uniref:Homeobox domain-containing protein n=1 Tax=Vairimorpha apis BRL 01 TaxID=1037528 RepID=T0L3F8_9MICR|nr:homeobox domain-containing protein [Vairimorpha apis BRL 01]